MQPNQLKRTGGAKTGWASASKPFAVLAVDKDHLILNASVMGNLHFRPSDVLSIEPYSFGLQSGLMINHRVAGYKQSVMFINSGSTAQLLEEIIPNRLIYIRDCWKIDNF